MDLNALVAKYGSSNEDAIETALGRIVGVSHDAAEDKSRPRVATRHLLEELADAAEAAVTGSYTSSGLDAIIRRQPLAIGAGASSASSRELDTLQGYVEQLKALPPAQQQGVGIAIGDLLEGKIVVDGSGALELEQEKQNVEAELANANRDLAKLQPLKDAAIKLATIRDDTERTARTKAIEAIAMRRTPVMPDGSLPSADATMTATNTRLENEKLALQQQLDRIKAATSVATLFTADKAGVHRAVAHTYVVMDESKLQPEDKTFLGI